MSSYSFRAVSSIFRYRSSNPEIFSGSGLQDSQVLFRRWIISCIRPCISLFQYGLAHYPCCLSDTAAHGQDIPDGLSHNYKKWYHGHGQGYPGNPPQQFPLLLRALFSHGLSYSWNRWNLYTHYKGKAAKKRIRVIVDKVKMTDKKQYIFCG